MRSEKLEHLAITGMVGEKKTKRKGKQREKMLDGPTKWLEVG